MNESLRSKGREQLSGRYIYHSTKNSVDIFVRNAISKYHFGSGPRMFGIAGSEFFLICRNDYWFITNEKYAFGEKIFDESFSSFLRLKIEGLITKTVSYLLNLWIKDPMGFLKLLTIAGKL